MTSQFILLLISITLAVYAYMVTTKLNRFSARLHVLARKVKRAEDKAQLALKCIDQLDAQGCDCEVCAPPQDEQSPLN